MTRLDELFAPRLGLGEQLLEVAVGEVRLPGEAAAHIVLHLLGIGLIPLLFRFHKSYYAVGLTDRRLLLLGVDSRLTITDEKEVPRDDPALAKVSFKEVPGSLRMSTSLLSGELEFAPLLLEANRDRARAIGEAMGSFERNDHAAHMPTDVVPFSGLRRLRLALIVSVPLVIALIFASVLVLPRGLGAACGSDSGCRGQMFCSRKLHPSGVCTLPCERQTDCPAGYTCADRACEKD